MSCLDVAPAPQLPVTAMRLGLSVLILSLLLGWRTVQGAAMGAAVMGARILSKGMTGVGVIACGRFTFLASSSFVFINVRASSKTQYGLLMFSMTFSYIVGAFLCRRLLPRFGVRGAVAIAGALSLSGGTLMGLLAMAGFAMGGWLGTHLDGTVLPLAYGVWFCSVLIALAAWTLVQKYGETGEH